MKHHTFPELAGRRYGNVNLDLEARIWLPKNPGASLLKVDTCIRMVYDIHEKYGIDFSYGGWMEDRTFLWKGSYLDKHHGCVHLGVDINVPMGAEVVASFSGTIVRVDDDHPEPEGWGPRVIVRHHDLPICMIYAHLSPKIRVSAGNEIEAGTVIGTVGSSNRNGGWFPHLHVQAIRSERFEAFSITNKWNMLDGYGPNTSVKKLAQDFPDPMQFILI